MAPLWSTLSRVKLLSLPFCLFINLFLTEYQSARTDKNKTKTSAPRSDGRWASWLYIYVYKLSRTFQQKWSFQMNLKFISRDAILHLLTYETLLKQEESKKLYCNICSYLFFSLFSLFFAVSLDCFRRSLNRFHLQLESQGYSPVSYSQFVCNSTSL